MISDFRFSIDRGGTFTDIYCEYLEDNQPHSLVEKLLSKDPSSYLDAPTEGIRRILEKVLKVPQSYPVSTSQITSIRMGTTVATNALLERKGKPFVLVTTKGFKDLLLIHNQSRPNIFDLNIKRSNKLFTDVIEIDERVQILKHAQPGAVQGRTGEYFEVLTPLNESEVYSSLSSIRSKGIDTLAVCLLHSYSYTLHEERIRAIASSLNFSYIALSSEIMPMFKYLPRMSTTSTDAYLTPILQEYIHQFRQGFDSNFDQVSVLFMQSDGGLCEMSSFIGSKAILSGPAGGVVGYSASGAQPLIGFDMGGTSTDVSRFDQSFSHVFETEISGVSLQGSHLDIQTVAAGGGSRLFYRSGLFTVGPESSGAFPGPVCYRNGGFLSITDANLVLGRLRKELFPKIFGEEKDLELDLQAAESEFARVAEQVYKDTGVRKTIHELALGFVQVANETMCRPIRAITSAKGYDPGAHTLSCFGGAGGQHACSIARILGMRKIVVHRFSGILSAYGLGLADLTHELITPSRIILKDDQEAVIDCARREMVERIRESFKPKGIKSIEFRTFVHLRFEGSDTCLPVEFNGRVGQAIDRFKQDYFREFGFLLTGRDLICDSIRVTAIAKASCITQTPATPTSEPKPSTSVDVYFDINGQIQALPTQVFKFNELPALYKIPGPALVVNEISCVVIEPSSHCFIDHEGNLEIVLESIPRLNFNPEVLDSVLLSLFAHRFMSIAEQMGRTLQRTSISTNIKERLDYSCAIFSADGSLVANAPHLPVHLGSMQEAVKSQIELNPAWREGEVLCSNHPQAGGSHLPDITVITPVFSGGAIVFFVASRGHHADIGGSTPGSMPPFSKSLAEEGVAIMSLKLVLNGEFQESTVRELFKVSRCIEDNVSDLKAQTSANNKGIELILRLIEEYSLDVVLGYMRFIQTAARNSVEDLLVRTFTDKGDQVLRAKDFLDDGTKIQLQITLSGKKATFDFTGTGCQVLSNLNSPPSVVKSAILYCLRCMVATDIPLNQGCMEPITLIVPKHSILSPSASSAVVGGNVLTSQRITDVIFKAFGACAASQGCMNNLTFGNASFGFYETIAGGSGAGPGFAGESGVHTHMTNTRITDVEIMERRYPVLVKRFEIRPNSGGKGRFRGGNGVVREIEFLENMQTGILSERRSFRPYGLLGGGEGKRGKNFLVKEGQIVNIGGKNLCDVGPGDRIIICTPGGGGYGAAG